jgi:hypothetical protein
MVSPQLSIRVPNTTANLRMSQLKSLESADRKKEFPQLTRLTHSRRQVEFKDSIFSMCL